MAEESLEDMIEFIAHTIAMLRAAKIEPVLEQLRDSGHNMKFLVIGTLRDQYGIAQDDVIFDKRHSPFIEKGRKLPR